MLGRIQNDGWQIERWRRGALEVDHIWTFPYPENPRSFPTIYVYFDCAPGAGYIKHGLSLPKCAGRHRRTIALLEIPNASHRTVVLVSSAGILLQIKAFNRVWKTSLKGAHRIWRRQLRLRTVFLSFGGHSYHMGTLISYGIHRPIKEVHTVSFNRPKILRKPMAHGKNLGDPEIAHLLQCRGREESHVTRNNLLGQLDRLHLLERLSMGTTGRGDFVPQSQ
ncbi:hypothetical protein B0H13DRAFT_1873345 [Mycena leptocephala]|nr:hypothetical protein B0H13DRAFT_1873345 [Mycena leptocephala]